ncbi:hypothetical protein NXV33_18115 [Bacteroides thetaiotaomicron]|nr:hypothetical protein [Bacteroides thetaiotaomicron]
MTLLYGDRDIGEDFTDLPDVNSRKNKGAITVKFELSSLVFSLATLLISGIKNIHQICANLYQPVPHASTFWKSIAG